MSEEELQEMGPVDYMVLEWDAELPVKGEVIPLLLDLVLLASPKVSVEPLFEDMAAIAEETLGLAGEVQPGGAEAAAAPSAGDANVLAAMEQMDLLRAAMADFNLLSLLALNRLLLPLS